MQFVNDDGLHSGQISTRRFLVQDPTIDCESAAYADVRLTALIFVGLWPIGVPALYSALLFFSRRAVFSPEPNGLSRAIRFLTAV